MVYVHRHEQEGSIPFHEKSYYMLFGTLRAFSANSANEATMSACGAKEEILEGKDTRQNLRPVLQGG